MTRVCSHGLGTCVGFEPSHPARCSAGLSVLHRSLGIPIFEAMANEASSVEPQTVSLLYQKCSHLIGSMQQALAAMFYTMELEQADHPPFGL